MAFTPEEQTAFQEWLLQHEKLAFAVVRRQLAKRTLPSEASPSSIVQSVWCSLMQHHWDSLKTSDAVAARELLLKLIYKHVNTIIRREQRRGPLISLDAPLNATETPLGASLPDPNQLPPELFVTIQSILFHLTGVSNETERPNTPEELSAKECLQPIENSKPNEDSSAAMSLEETSGIIIPPEQADQALELVLRLTPLEKAVLGLKLAGYSRPEIAEQLRVLDPLLNEFRIDRIWASIRRQADELD
jgi:hypothetical protein